MIKKIYLDYAATTPLDKQVLNVMLPYFDEQYGNSASIHSYGQEAMNAVDEARERVASFLGSVPQEIIFTSGATESNNLILRGAVREYKKKNPGFVPHVITSLIEHDSVLETVKELEKDKEITVSYIPVNAKGVVLLDQLENLIRDNTILVSIMYANNEIGTIEPIGEIGKLLRRKNEYREHKIIFHTDAAQAAGYLDCNIEKLGVDALSLSGHKIYGPKGISALYIRKGISIAPIMTGGGQEYKKRSGTLNVPAVVGLGQAVVEVRKNIVSTECVEKLRDLLIQGISESIPEAEINGATGKDRLPNSVNFCFPGAEGESIVIMLDQAGIAASTGSACASKSLEPSHVLLAIGVPKEKAHSSVRLTLGKYTTEEEVKKVIEVLPGIVKRLREIAGAAV